MCALQFVSVGALRADEIPGSRVGSGRKEAVALAGEAVAVSQNPGFAYDTRTLGVAGVIRDQ